MIHDRSMNKHFSSNGACVEWQFCMTIKVLKQRKAIPIPSTRILSSRLFVTIVSRTHTSKIKKESEVLCSTLFSSNWYDVTCGRDTAYFYTKMSHRERIVRANA